MLRKIITILLFSILSSCSNQEFVILIEQPKENKLDNALLEIKIDNNKIYSKNLKTTNIASVFDDVSFLKKDKENYKLEVTVGAEKFEYDIKYPEDRYIIIAPFYEEGKIHNGIVKRKEKFILD